MEFKPLNADEYYARENAYLASKAIAELEAKVYVYEKIIANSNFAPMVKAMNTPTGACMGEATPAEERKARWILQTSPFSEKEHQVICSNCCRVAMTFENFSLEEAKQSAKREENAIYLTNYCADCGCKMEVDI